MAPLVAHGRLRRSLEHFLRELGGLGDRVQLLAAKAADRASGLPHLVCIRLEGSPRDVRARLIELGSL